VTTVEAPVTHQWSVVAPWWHWPLRLTTDPHDPGPLDERRSVRTSRPVFQKYETTNLVNTFLADPQQRLKFQPATDEVWNVSRAGFGKWPARTPTGRRKLYLASHHRHYLVVCSLRCETAGFPHATRDDVCEAGFVVRRRRADFPDGPSGEIARDLRRHALARTRRLDLERRLMSPESRFSRGGFRSAALEARLNKLVAKEREAENSVLGWAKTNGKIRVLDGWIPTGVDKDGHREPMPACDAAETLTPLAGAGSWQPVDELPDQLAEAWFPLSPLVADPMNLDHDAAGESIYFGVVPTGSADLDERQLPRFDAASEYDIRCFVRRHRAACPRSGGHCTCPLTWSEPTEAYQLAAPLDLEGTANRPMTVHMPDLEQLHADAVRLSPGGFGGVRFRSPPRSDLSFTSKDTTATRLPPNGAEQVCSFAIPLITIVAFFVLRLFLPIVVFVFQLWFLLALRLCLPPTVDIDADLAMKLDAIGGGLDVDAVAVIDLERNCPTFMPALSEMLGGSKITGSGGATTMAQRITDARANGEIDDESFGSLVRGVFAADLAEPPKLCFAPRVTRSQVVRP